MFFVVLDTETGVSSISSESSRLDTLVIRCSESNLSVLFIFGIALAVLVRLV